MVHGLAAQLGGGLSIRSAPGEGTTIELWLPISEGGAGSEGRAARVRWFGGRGTALLVDDEELVRMSTADMLTDLGFQVVEAATAEEALGLIECGHRCRCSRDRPSHAWHERSGTGANRTVASSRLPGIGCLRLR